jgi:hypothetical protein
VGSAPIVSGWVLLVLGVRDSDTSYIRTSHSTSINGEDAVGKENTTFNQNGMSLVHQTEPRTPVKKIVIAMYKITFDISKKVTKMPKKNGFY